MNHNTSTELCQTNVCCTRPYTINYLLQQNHYVLASLDWNETIIPPPTCPPICTVYCDQTLTLNQPDPVNCYMCESGLWSNWIEATVSTVCTNYSTCIIKFRYRSRTNTLCDPAYYDYEFSDYTLENCDNCIPPVDVQLAESLITDWMIKNGGLDLPGLGQTWTNYRVAKAKCWQLPETLSVGTRYKECDASNFACCKLKYAVTKDMQGNVTFSPLPLTEQEPYPYPTVYQCIPPCISHCWTEITRKPIIEEANKINININFDLKAFSAPNPSKENMDLHLTGTYKGKLNIKVFDQLGRIYLDGNYQKNNIDFIVSLQSNNLQNGTYFYKILIDDELIFVGTFVLLR